MAGTDAALIAAISGGLSGALLSGIINFYSSARIARQTDIRSDVDRICSDLEKLCATAEQFWKEPSRSSNLGTLREKIRRLSGTVGSDLSRISRSETRYRHCLKTMATLRDAIAMDPYDDDTRAPSSDRVRAVQDAEIQLRDELRRVRPLPFFGMG